MMMMMIDDDDDDDDDDDGDDDKGGGDFDGDDDDDSFKSLTFTGDLFNFSQKGLLCMRDKLLANWVVQVELPPLLMN
ncbi:hypothetical protein DPMN_088676 [Dreissena polymorpha]|uniref:Uncharacterized protein n=1 Tax=Dreissena polymorpha TaxID=45954 RepID=A0A9D4QY38_DREPO|nr:hypothetical protein DPMN_088676 [Dreissena polymorpha]